MRNNGNAKRLEELEHRVAATAPDCEHCGDYTGWLVRIHYRDGTSRYDGREPCEACGSPDAQRLDIVEPDEPHEVYT